MKNKITQKQMVFHMLLKERMVAGKISDLRYIPTWEFAAGDQFLEGLGWVLMSYKCPTRLTDIYQDNPGLLERKIIKGKSGSSYYGYRINPSATKKDVADPSLISVYSKLKKALDSQKAKDLYEDV